MDAAFDAIVAKGGDYLYNRYLKTKDKPFSIGMFLNSHFHSMQVTSILHDAKDLLPSRGPWHSARG